MFKERLKELLDEKQTYGTKFACETQICSKSTIYDWLNGKQFPKVDKAIKLREYFSCSLDYLFNNAEYEEIKSTKQVSTFAKRLKEILKDKKIKEVDFFKNLKYSTANITKWFKLNANPRMDTVAKIANYFQVSIDYLVGLE